MIIRHSLSIFNILPITLELRLSLDFQHNLSIFHSNIYFCASSIIYVLFWWLHATHSRRSVSRLWLCAVYLQNIINYEFTLMWFSLTSLTHCLKHFKNSPYGHGGILMAKQEILKLRTFYLLITLLRAFCVWVEILNFFARWLEDYLNKIIIFGKEFFKATKVKYYFDKLLYLRVLN
jgi:hypothetical protein